MIPTQAIEKAIEGGWVSPLGEGSKVCDIGERAVCFSKGGKDDQAIWLSEIALLMLVGLALVEHVYFALRLP